MTSQSLRLFTVAPFILLLASCASDAKPTPASEAPKAVAPPKVAAVASPEQDEDEPTGKSLYERHCAGCHNANGDGRGATMLAQGKQARSFAQGGFAFGNTPEAIFKTITSGIPGSSLMQGFKSVMDDDERHMVAEYVLTLTPYKAEAKSKDSVMVVGDRAVFAYGKLPSIHEGLPERPRGLMVGLLGGLSFEYRVDDVRLLAVRRGSFVDREDWNERGGGYLKPLGDVVFDVEGGDPQPWLRAMVDGKLVPVEFSLIATRESGPAGRTAQVELAPKVGSPNGVSDLLVEMFQPQLSEPESFGRRMTLVRTNSAPELEVTIASGPPGSIESMSLHSASGAPPTHTEGWIVFSRAGGFDCVHVSCIGGVGRAGPIETVDRIAWGLDAHPASGPITLESVVVHVKSWDGALLDRLTKELAR